MNNPHSAILEYVGKKIALSENDREILISSFHFVKKDKNDLILRKGSKTEYLYFIINGYMRCFHQKEGGEEVTTQIWGPGDFATSFESFLKSNLSPDYIQCISNCELLCITKNDHENLYSAIEGWPLFCQNVYETYILRMSERMHILQNLSASERYMRLLNKQPNIALNTSVKHLASYLGIQPQSLSRIRKSIK
ncbi:MAG: Crp/Fnr family transcriptional regulator [Sporocytophaga sp.]|uniref:Crp/Fnr family transcriptional regulator n=1 Tax=Sporocytophaga sp. TaxID=2231183 RepID=UPI001B17259C|nr:Crp/Fnr family transcriptional regulator [Sporocytophaga sp.]MBO9703636.1 Crp/Fnr family transcriptional regulator [Sporocytophaga sp.]